MCEDGLVLEFAILGFLAKGPRLDITCAAASRG
jgi:hypothetical protein